MHQHPEKICSKKTASLLFATLRRFPPVIKIEQDPPESDLSDRAAIDATTAAATPFSHSFSLKSEQYRTANQVARDLG
jgi:hypothetical protein